MGAGRIYLLLVLVCVTLYFRCLFYGVTNADDEVMITGNIPFLRNLSNVFSVFTTDAFYQHKEIDLYRPLQSLTYILDAQWGGDVVFYSHLTNLILHVLCCIAVYHLLLRLDFRQSLAVTGALVYAVHYLFMTAVAWIPARGDLLLALFTFMTVLTLISLLELPRWRTILLHLLFFSLALFSKESAVVIPIVCAVYIWAYRRTGLLVRMHVALPIYYVAAISFYWMLKDAAVASSNGERGVAQFLKNIHLLPEMVAKFYLPVNMSTLPGYVRSSAVTGAGVLVLLAITCMVFRRLRQRSALFHVAWFFLFILPGLTYYPNFYAFTNEHVDNRSYVICFGLLMLNLHIIQQFEGDRSRYWRSIFIMVLCYLAACNLYLGQSYRNPASFALKAITMESNSALAFANYGTEKFLEGDELEALRYLNQSLRLVRTFMPALHYRARIFWNRGMYREALSDLDTIFSVDPEYDAADYALRGMIKSQLQDDTAAEADFVKALQMRPALPEAQKGLQELRRPGRNNVPPPHLRNSGD
jgi:tetratricopeptide (TPR) repeat protein